jgi:hypothetical protein
MSALDPNIDLHLEPAPRTRRGPLLDRLNIASLAWAALFAVVTAVLVVVLR